MSTPLLTPADRPSVPVSTRPVWTLPPCCSACSLPAIDGAGPVPYVTPLMMSGWALTKFSIIPFVSCRLPATSRMLSVTGLLGLSAAAAPELAGAAVVPVLGEPQALARTAKAASTPAEPARRPRVRRMVSLLLVGPRAPGSGEPRGCPRGAAGSTSGRAGGSGGCAGSVPGAVGGPGRAPGRPRRRSSRSTAARPAASVGIAMVVNGGVAIAAIAMSSHPMTLISRGTSTPRAARRDSTPMAIRSLKARMPVTPLASARSAAWTPEANTGGERSQLEDLDAARGRDLAQAAQPLVVGPGARRTGEVGDPAVAERGQVLDGLADAVGAVHDDGGGGALGPVDQHDRRAAEDVARAAPRPCGTSRG